MDKEYDKAVAATEALKKAIAASEMTPEEQAAFEAKVTAVGKEIMELCERRGVNNNMFATIAERLLYSSMDAMFGEPVALAILSAGCAVIADYMNAEMADAADPEVRKILTNFVGITGPEGAN